MSRTPARGGAGGAVHYLDYPTEVTTGDGTLATIEAIAPDDEARFFSGFVWPLGRTRIKARWSRAGRLEGADRGFDIDPASPEASACIAKYAGA